MEFPIATPELSRLHVRRRGRPSRRRVAQSRALPCPSPTSHGPPLIPPPLPSHHNSLSTSHPLPPCRSSFNPIACCHRWWRWSSRLPLPRMRWPPPAASPCSAPPKCQADAHLRGPLGGEGPGLGGGWRTASPEVAEGAFSGPQEGDSALHRLQAEDLRPLLPMLGAGALCRGLPRPCSVPQMLLLRPPRAGLPGTPRCPLARCRSR